MIEKPMPMWELRGISKAFPGVQALDNVSIDLFPGEVHALLGENGSGKSTLAKCLSGAHVPERGEILYRGTPVTIQNPQEARRLGIATIYQEFSLVPSLSVAENIFLGRYQRVGKSGLVDWSAMQAETCKILDQLSLSLDPDATVKELSVAEQQLVEIAKAISMESTLLIMDEPTAALGLIETQHLLELIRRLTSQSKAILYISHRLDEVYEIADRITILKDGRKVASAPAAELKARDAVKAMVGFDIQQHYPKERNATTTPRLVVEHISTENGIHDVSFTVHAGEVFGLGGMLGSGRTEIARAIFGLDRLTGGRILLDGRPVRFHSPAEAIAKGVGLIPENRKTDGVFFNFDGTKNITVARLKAVVSGLFLNLTAERRAGQTYVKKLNITPSALEKSVRFLSGGNQQKIIVARWLFSRARLLILDEPTQGIDIGAKLEIYKIINELTGQGISIVFISSDIPELLAMCDRVAVVRDGRVQYVTESENLSELQLIEIASGVGIAQAIEQWMAIGQAASAHLRALQAQTGLAVQLAVLDRDQRQLYYLEKLTGANHTSGSQAGATGPLHATALGKALMAYVPVNELVTWLGQGDLAALTNRTITNPSELIADLVATRTQGFGLDQEESETGVAGIALPVFDAGGNVVAAIGVSGSPGEVPTDPPSPYLLECLQAATHRVQQALPAEAVFP